MATDQGVILCTDSSNNLVPKDLFDKHMLITDVVTYHPNREIKITISHSVRDKRVYIFGYFDNVGHQGPKSINDGIMEIMNMVDACKRSDAKSVCLFLPYYPYARSDKKDDGRCAIGAAMVTKMFECAGVNRIVTLDLHAAQIQGFAKVPFDNLYAIKMFCKFIQDNGMDDNDKFILVSPDQGGAKRVTAYATRLNMDYAIMHKQRCLVDGVNSVQKISLLTEAVVQDKTAILIDDMIDTCGTMVAACDFLKTKGIGSVTIMASHGVLSGPAINRINACDLIDKVVVTDSIPQFTCQQQCTKLHVLSIAPLMAQVIECLSDGGSISSLFK